MDLGYRNWKDLLLFDKIKWGLVVTMLLALLPVFSAQFMGMLLLITHYLHEG